MNNKERIYVDMDDTLCDFTGAHKAALARVPSQKFPQAQMDFFRKLEPLDGAIEAMNTLSEFYEVWILSRPSYLNPLCYTEWCEKLILCSDKSLLIGEWLIDDVLWHDFKGTQIQFGGDIDWNWITKDLIRDRFNDM
jgi:5'-nucleotidase